VEALHLVVTPAAQPEETRVCKVCGLEKTLTGTVDGFYKKYPGRVCVKCKRELSKKWEKDHPEQARATNKAHYVKTREWVKQANADNPQFAAENRERQRKWRTVNPLDALIRNAKYRASSAGLPFDLTSEDISIPDFCPVLGIPIVYGSKGPKAGSPSLDRFIPKLGYVRGNVAVISWRANNLKSDGTLEEIEAVVAWMRKRVRDLLGGA
jgi:hypothetical protein